VLRFWNSDVDQNLSAVMESILIALKAPTPTG
jgi:very-short-patch-repair endonuclease